MRIQTIVEGYGEVSAVPVLLRRLLVEAGKMEIVINRPIRQKQSQLLSEDSLRKAIRLAMYKPECSGILVLFEEEDGCPKELGPRLATWIQREAGNFPVVLALAHREYEAWFLAAIESIRGKRGICENALINSDPESIRDAKGAIEDLMLNNRCYHETTDQAALSELFDIKMAYRNSRSFRHLVKAFGKLLQQMGVDLMHWPPAEWDSI